MCSNPNMNIWVQVQDTPKEARKPIQAGRLKGMTDINPMWRFKKLTETFGPCGIGWKYEIANKWLETGLQNEIKAFVEVRLYIRDGEKWSEAIPGIGGSSFVAVERSGPYCSDECYKMALTDAISVCCKALGMSADIYFEKDRDKYTAGDGETGERIATSPAAPRNDRGGDPSSALRAPSPQGEGNPAGPAPGRQTRLGLTGKCKRCGAEIDEQTESYTRQRFRVPLCRPCQAAAIKYEQEQQAKGDVNNG